MKLSPNRNQCRAGVTIVESIAYIALVAFLLMCGVRFFNVVYHHNKAVAKATAYTTSVLDAAKHWRRDVYWALPGPWSYGYHGFSSHPRLAVRQISTSHQQSRPHTRGMAPPGDQRLLEVRDCTARCRHCAAAPASADHVA